ncbi:hypothetical protein FXO38_26051 [Capsicum annuum]|uniref:Uncharacterized protein n=1 Tax=Capsicum annuum TaxID=4072 RepID=A0A2G2ZN42_CAPAN|nr:hypothetical protein FXO37_31126 [Capsicum annuum]KAF3632665.1 hypothetical protein FXO38_26051 [Capsicum annuum]PHT83409.1 hypothetical protein T459_11852 [Capsicum annuum]
MEEHDFYTQPRRDHENGGDMYKIKAEISTFNGNVNIEGFFDWIYEVDTFFEIMNIPTDYRVPLVAYKLKGEKFLRLQVRCNIYENEDQQVARYINGLNDSVQERLGIQQIWSIDQAQTLVLKAERYIKTKKSYKAASYSRPESISKSTPRQEEGKFIPSKEEKDEKAPSSSKNNDKQPSNTIKCYNYREEGHISRNYPRRKFVNTTRRDVSDEEVDNYESKGEPELCEEEG